MLTARIIISILLTTCAVTYSTDDSLYDDDDELETLELLLDITQAHAKSIQKESHSIQDMAATILEQLLKREGKSEETQQKLWVIQQKLWLIQIQSMKIEEKSQAIETKLQEIQEQSYEIREQRKTILEEARQIRNQTRMVLEQSQEAREQMHAINIIQEQLVKALYHFA